MTLGPLFQNIVSLRRPGVAIFADIIKIKARFIQKIFRVSGKVKELEIMYQNCINQYLHFLI